MANNLTFTSAPFLQGLTASSANSSVNTRYTILSTDATNARRIYGISLTSTDAGAQTVTIYLNDGVSAYQLFQISITANSGNSTTVAAADIMGSVYGAALLQKQRDANGVPYFNLPATWSVQYTYNTTLLAAEGLYILVFGETYA
jgi:hypothetical protein